MAFHSERFLASIHFCPVTSSGICRSGTAEIWHDSQPDVRCNRYEAQTRVSVSLQYNRSCFQLVNADKLINTGAQETQMLWFSKLHSGAAKDMLWFNNAAHWSPLFSQLIGYSLNQLHQRLQAAAPLWLQTVSTVPVISGRNRVSDSERRQVFRSVTSAQRPLRAQMRPFEPDTLACAWGGKLVEDKVEAGSLRRCVCVWENGAATW